MTFTMTEVYDALKRWKADLIASEKWSTRDEELLLAVTILLARPKKEKP